ncbi:cytochrome-c peroxidase [Roseibaca sp. V10]|uniref:Cytochrome-c peroxidase n=1 Tax=Roseinatronobacter domitianus TaxID=2940293 RepID=A0ABT0M1P6_9RHOB|nr:cytochrome c peroxidase [Roseibaca domitiana]MCL1628779.1 cytochrome-c peroxidase [Roseibaca domitiana]
MPRFSINVIAAAVSLGISAPNAVAQSLESGFSALERGDFATAYRAMREAAAQGDARAASMMGEIFGVGPYARPSEAPSASQTATPAAPQLRPEAAVPAGRLLAPVVIRRPPPRPFAVPTRPEGLIDDMFAPVDLALAEIGRDLFFDPVLSGNKDVSCATCHHPTLASGDGVSLGLGTGAVGLGDDRSPTGPYAAAERIPRNAPALWNLGARDIRVLFHDGRVERDPSNPAAVLTPQGPLEYMALDSILATQALFPVLSHAEMAGRAGENEIATAVAQERIHGDTGAWGLLAARVDALDGYRTGFAAWRGQDAAVGIDEIANAIAAFISHEFRANDTAFDRYMREEAALSPEAGEGMRLFFGKARCAECHSGPLLSDQRFHAMGEPPIGPGKERDSHGYTRDIGRAAFTLDRSDAYAFRTPMLRNVVHSGPWGHAGAFSDLRDFLIHHMDPVKGLERYSPQAVLPQLASAVQDYGALSNRMQLGAVKKAAASTMRRYAMPALSDAEIGMILAFLDALSDPASLDGRLGAPDTLPSGLQPDR